MRNRTITKINIALIILLTAFAVNINAADFVVTKTADTNDGACDSDCSLREAIAAANGVATDDRIFFDATVFGSTQTITLGGTGLVIGNNGNLLIIGTTPNDLTISGDNTSRIFNINTGPTVEITNMTLTEGDDGAITSSTNLTVNNVTITDNEDGGISSSLGTLNVVFSNIINNIGRGITANVLNMTNSTVSNNSNGGIIYSGNTSIVNSTISNNSSVVGGGITPQSFSGLDLTIINSTISGNSASNFGGGINTDGGDFINVTVAHNTAGSFAGGVNAAGPINIKNSIIGNNTSSSSPDFNGTITSQGYNLIGDTDGTSITGTTTGNILDQDPMLGALADNGGTTETHSLLPGSPAIDKGSAATVPFAPFNSTKSRKKLLRTLLPPLTNDQRGMMRPVDQAAIANATGGDGSDIGAFEALAPTAANVQISGRVLTSTGRGISRTTVEMADAGGNIRYAMTNQFGYYKFTNVEVGETYIFNVYAKRYQFAPQIINLNDSITDLNFVPS